MTIPDPIGLIAELLAADDDVAALAGENVFGGSLLAAADGGPTMPASAVVVSPAGGPGRHGVQGWRRNRIDTTCYGVNLYESWRMHLAVREALENARQSSPLLSIEIVSDGSNALDPVTFWPTCYATYSVLSAVTV